MSCKYKAPMIGIVKHCLCRVNKLNIVVSRFMSCKYRGPEGSEDRYPLHVCGRRRFCDHYKMEAVNKHRKTLVDWRHRGNYRLNLLWICPELLLQKVKWFCVKVSTIRHFWIKANHILSFYFEVFSVVCILQFLTSRCFKLFRVFHFFFECFSFPAAHMFYWNTCLQIFLVDICS